jgi:SAM-dependent methyltransferase
MFFFAFVVGFISLACVAGYRAFAIVPQSASLISFTRGLEPTKRLLMKDLKQLAKITDLDNFAQFDYNLEDVEKYYSATTFRDYRLLEFLTGCNAMHTDLVPAQKLPFAAKHLKQLMYVMMNMPHNRPMRTTSSNVLEVGFGKGSNSIFLRALKPSGVKFFGLDVLPAHVQYAKKSAANLGFDDNVEFHLGDAGNMPAAIMANTYDLIFGIESLCYLDTDNSVEGFLSFASKSLSPGGKIVIVDGFRADDFETLSADVRRAMELAESGFRIRRMASKATWKQLSERQGGFVVREDVDLTSESLPFWRKWWRFAHLLLRFAPFLVRKYLEKGGERTETFANFVSVCMTAYAMALGSAKYGVLVLEKV